MQYKNTELKIDHLVGYCNENTINLSPAFQRGHIWTLNGRENLLKNILSKKPIPAIFYYKEAKGSKYKYSILDGKQRIESIILFVNDSRSDLKITDWKAYFVNSASKGHSSFQVEVEGTKKRFNELNDAQVRDFREYVIPAIEITLDDDTNLDEVITLFVDINQQGVKVSRFNIVKAMFENVGLLKKTFKIIALRQKRKKDVTYKICKNPITRSFLRLKEMQRIKENNHKVDRIWEKLIDVLVYLQTGKHKNPAAILKTFLEKDEVTSIDISSANIQRLKGACQLINSIEKLSGDANNPLFTEYTHFYTALTTIAKLNLIKPDKIESLKPKLLKWCNILSKKELTAKDKKLKTAYETYKKGSSSQTTNPNQKAIREEALVEFLNLN
jgi:hypothetical protein